MVISEHPVRDFQRWQDELETRQHETCMNCGYGIYAGQKCMRIGQEYRCEDCIAEWTEFSEPEQWQNEAMEK